MKPDATESPKRTTLAVSLDFGKRVAELAHDSGLSAAEYCDRYLLPDVTRNWRAMLTRKLKATEKAESVKAGA